MTWENQSEEENISAGEAKMFYDWIMSGNRLFFVDELRAIINWYDNEKISLSKFCELLNEKVFVKYHSVREQNALQDVDEYLELAIKKFNLHADLSDEQYDGDKEAPLDRLGVIEWLIDSLDVAYKNIDYSREEGGKNIKFLEGLQDLIKRYHNHTGETGVGNHVYNEIREYITNKF